MQAQLFFVAAEKIKPPHPPARHSKTFPAIIPTYDYERRPTRN
jgi:hypothetical protein